MSAGKAPAVDHLQALIHPTQAARSALVKARGEPPGRARSGSTRMMAALLGDSGLRERASSATIRGQRARNGAALAQRGDPRWQLGGLTSDLRQGRKGWHPSRLARRPLGLKGKTARPPGSQLVKGFDPL